MTSKEALKNIRNNHENEILYDYQVIEDSYNVVERDLEDFEWLKSKLNLVFLDTLSNLEDKERLLEIMGISTGRDRK